MYRLELCELFGRFAAACTGGGRPSVARVTTAARRLADKRHYAEAHISQLAHRLERAYKQLSAGECSTSPCSTPMEKASVLSIRPFIRFSN